MNSKVDHIINELKGKQSIPNFVVLLFIILLLVIDFMPYFESMEIINPQFLYLAVLNLIIGVYFFFNPNLISNQIVPIIQKCYVFRIYLAFLFFCGITIFSAKNTSLVLTKFTEIAIVFCLFLNLCILLKNKLDLIYKIIFIICLSAFLQSWQQLCNFIIIPRHASIMSLLGAMKGNTGNINILAASLTIKVPFLLLGISNFKTYKKWFSIVALFSVTAVIFLTGARTPLISLFLIFSVYIIYIIRENSFTRLAFTNILYLIIPVLIAVLFSNTIFTKSTDKNRYDSIGNKVEKFNAEDGSSKLRLIYWGNAIKISEKNPVLGIGLGNYQVESIPYEKTAADGFIVSLHTHNDFLEIMAETGVLNGLIYLSLFVFIIVANSKKILKSKDNNVRAIAVLTLMLVIAYGIDSSLNFPMYRPTMQLFFALMLALTVANNSKLSIEYKSQKQFAVRITCSILIIAAIITSYSAYLIYKASHLEYLIAGDNINLNEKGALSGDKVVALIPKYPNVLSSSEAFYEYAAIYYIREKNYEKALKCFSKASKINPYSGRIDFYKQLIAIKRGKIDSAYIYSKQAFNLRPRNYDLYKGVTHYSIMKKDTLELIKNHAIFSRYSNVPETWVTVANVLQSSGADYKRIIRFVNEGLKKMPNDSVLLKKKNQLLITSYLQGGQNFETQSDLSKALESYEKALKIDPKNIYVTQNIGFNYFKQGQNKKAISSLLDALKYPGLNDGKTEFFLGICYLKENDKTNAMKYFTISKDKKYPPAKQLISQFSSIQSDQAVLKKRKNDLLIADYITEGQKFEDQKKLGEALTSYEKALKIDPKSIYAHQNIGFYYLKTGQAKKAINNLLNALKYPGLNDGKTEYFLAICYLQEGNKTNACKYLNISKDKKYSDAQQLIEKICK
ncbi:O-antigen ligase family protein [Flavobacterium sp. 1355]|uniref:O-antigen ligase family protein n=1 Tax=Flavobacterium sp. 1355 TaxID=2806571 RepID=UPI001AE30A78|nr:O-antigen ligase family protein [Flavobacterium sp. 1355]MBP1224552.1 tetratricopeptide (TPR) repeat protein [Flavobacterium sp. 1355]